MSRILNANEIMYTAFEPLQSNRFVFNLEGVPSYIIKKAQAPNVDLGEIVLDHMNVYRKIKSKARWGDITLSLWVPISPSGQQAVMEWLRLHHESATGRDGYSDMYKRDCSLELFGPLGDVVTEWIIKGAYIKSSNFGELDWSGDPQAVEIGVTLAMDYCILNY